MLYISHRGNLNKIDKIRENSPSYVAEAVNQGFNVEVDLWDINGQWFLGHDKPQYPIDYMWVWSNRYKLLVHCKNPAALNHLHDLSGTLKEKVHYFYHKNDPYTISSWNIPICYPGMFPIKNSIYVKPEEACLPQDVELYGIVSDYVKFYKKGM